MIVKGAQAQLSKDDRQPHLSESDADNLLANAINVYRREHRTSPARVVVHKTSKMTDGEIRGFQRVIEKHKIDVVELISMRRSLTRLFRAGTYPPSRGTFLRLQKASGLLYLRGSVQFFQTYPGMYVPVPSSFLFLGRRRHWSNLRRKSCLSKLTGTTRNSMAGSRSPFGQRVVLGTSQRSTRRRRVQPVSRFYM